MTTGRATVGGLGPQVSTGWTLGLLLLPLGRLLLGLLCLGIKFLDPFFKDFIPVISEPEVIAAVIEPQGKLLPGIWPHDPAHLLNMGGQGLGERPGRHPNHHIRDIKPPGENVRRNQPMNVRVRTGKVLNRIPLEGIIVLV